MCDHSKDQHSVESQRSSFPLYQAVTFALCSVLFVWCAQGAADFDAARGATATMAIPADPGAAARQAAADEVRRVCRGKPLAVKVCSEEIRARYAK